MPRHPKALYFTTRELDQLLKVLDLTLKLENMPKDVRDPLTHVWGKVIKERTVREIAEDERLDK